MSFSTPAPRRPVILVIMDGIGVNPSRLNNAVAMAETPNLDRIWSTTPTCLLEASGRAVGLPPGQMGNSEVGHLSLGAGTVLKQDLVKISDSIDDGSFFNNDALLAAMASADKRGKPLHLMGLVSDGGVHSHVDHLIALVRMCAQNGVVPIVHMITDGRDTAPRCADTYLPDLQAALTDANGRIATVSGRYFAMDRDQRWDRVERAWQAIVRGEGRHCADVAEALQQARDADESDEFITPTVLANAAHPEAGDACVFFNFRNDRPREITEALADPDFDAFDRGDFKPVSMTTMTRYSSAYSHPFAFTKDVAEITLGDVVSNAGIAQLRSAETEKYPHVTFFFNGGRDEPLPGEDRILVDSPRVATYDLQPEMSAPAVTDAIVDALSNQQHGLIVVNLANGDMVGHTGVPEAVVQAVEVVDDMVGRLWQSAIENGYSVVLTADHGNADMLKDPLTDEPHTQHTTFPVACAVHDKDVRRLANGYGLPSIAPTILWLMGLPKPDSMSGVALPLDG